MRWKDKLTKKELSHLRETLDTLTLRDFRRSRKWQNERGRNSASNRELCFSCRRIALKLGIET